ncbi:hypothetical protein QYE76_002799 [Lolium multiflorum]|uniref:Transposase (putative) gypsy type domain-containing protein n=1 Tax=Lolium multiflorum TaxID=4521 RepID=A0AAD8RNX5_LOLMU|nr:hypothetical protein QYE76_002799 [Lolium multiflorum]
MGKKKSASTSDAAKVSRDWSASAISNRDVNKLRALGFISAFDDDIRLPGAVSRPRPPKGFTVMFVAFLFRGLSLPAHEFLRSLLFFYGIQLWQLTPNSILHLSIFITVCEAFLGIDPPGSLEEDLLVKRHNGNAPPSSVALALSVKADKLFEQIVVLKNTGGLTMCGTEVVSVFLQRRVQPLMSRPHQLWLYTRKGDKSRISSADLSTDELRDEVRRLTCLSMKDNIVLTSARSPYDFDHLPTEASSVVQCYPPTPESGVEPEDDDDDSEETEDVQQVFEDSDVQEDDTAEDAAFTRSKHRKQIDEDFITTAESSPSKQDNDAVGASPPSPADKGPLGFFAAEDDLELSDDDHVPLAKRAKLSVEKMASAKEPNPLLPCRRPIYAIVDAVVDFAEQFTRLEVENAQLRKTVKSSADRVLEANRLVTDAKKENALLKEELSKLKQQMKDEQDARRAAAVAIDRKEGVLRESIKDLLEAANITVTRRHQLREDSTSDALSLAAESNVQVLGLMQETRGALSRLYSMIFPKMKQDKTLGEMADAFLADSSEPVEIPSSSSCAELFPNPSTNDESDLVHRLRDQVSRLNKDITSLRAMAALVKKKGEIATAIEQYALDGLHVATESLGVVSSDKSEENKKIHEKVEAMTDVAHPKHDLWLHRPKAVIMAKFEYRVEKLHYYFDKFHAHLTMVWKTLFPLDIAPETLSALFTRFKSPERIRQLVRKELLAGAELAFASVLACHPSLDFRAVANTERSLGQYYDIARCPAYTIISRMETCLERDLRAQGNQGAQS